VCSSDLEGLKERRLLKPYEQGLWLALEHKVKERKDNGEKEEEPNHERGEEEAVLPPFVNVHPDSIKEREEQSGLKPIRGNEKDREGEGTKEAKKFRPREEADIKQTDEKEEKGFPADPGNDSLKGHIPAHISVKSTLGKASSMNSAPDEGHKIGEEKDGVHPGVEGKKEKNCMEGSKSPG